MARSKGPGFTLASAGMAAALLLAGCGGSSGGGGGDATASKAGEGKGKKYKIALSNSYIGNKWRVEMVNDFTSVCESEGWKERADCTVFNSGNDVSKQSQQISNLISQRVDAIIINAASPTGLNGVVKQACDRGILVVSFDSTVTEECGVQVNTDQVKFGEELAQFLVDKLGAKGGNIIRVTGVAGTSVDTDRNKGADNVFAKNPQIKVVSTFAGEWDSATAQRNTAGALPSLPKIHGIWAQGGTDGILKAFLDAGRPLPVTAGEAENGFRKFMAKQGYLGAPQVDGLSIGQPPFLSIASLETALQILEGKRPKKNVLLDFPKATSDDIVPGETVFPELEDSFFVAFTDAGENPIVKVCVDAALTGKPCPEPPIVNLPDPS